jgi:hypothetical protein
MDRAKLAYLVGTPLPRGSASQKNNSTESYEKTRGGILSAFSNSTWGAAYLRRFYQVGPQAEAHANSEVAGYEQGVSDGVRTDGHLLVHHVCLSLGHQAGPRCSKT